MRRKEPYSEKELEEMEGNPRKTRAYFVNVALNARALCLEHYFKGEWNKAVNMANYSDAILEYLDAFVQSTADSNTVAETLNEAMKAKRDQQQRNRRVSGEAS